MVAPALDLRRCPAAEPVAARTGNRPGPVPLNRPGPRTSAEDTLAGFGAPMRYLQTVCGAPQQADGAHWFPDTITVTVPFSHPA